MNITSPPPVMASSAFSSTSDRQASLSSASPQAPDSSSRPMQQPMIMELSSSTSTSSIDSSPFDQPSSRRLFHDTPTGSHHPQLAGLVSPTPTGYMHNGVSTPTTSADQDVFGKIDHTPLRQETYSTSPLPNSRSLQMGDMLDHVLDADQFSRLSVGNIIAPERNSSKKPPKRLPTDPGSMTASPTPASKTSARPRSTLTSITAASNNASASGAHTFGSSPVTKPFQQRPYPPSEELSMQVKQHMAALQESPQTH